MIIPTTSELYESIKTDLRGKLNISTLVGKMVLNAISAVQAAKLKIINLAISRVNKNIFVDTCDYDTIRRFGYVKLNRYPNAAVSGEYVINVTGDIGAVIPQGTQYKSTDDSSNPDQLFIFDSLYTFSATSGQIQVRATIAGVDSELIIGDQLQVTAPIANVDSYADVASIAVTPTAEEDIEEYRLNVIEAYRTEPQGGSRTDYNIWAQDATGVRRTYPYVKSGSAGDINLYVEALPDDSTPAGSGIPSAAILSDVEDVINVNPSTLNGRRPMGVFNIYYLPVNPLDIDITIVDLSPTVSTSAIENAVIAFLYNIRPFIDGMDNPNDRNDKLYEADIYKIVKDLLKSGESFTSITLEVDGNPEDIYTFENGDIPIFNSLTV